MSCLTFVVKNTFGIQVDVLTNLSLITGGKVAVFEDKYNQGLLKVYDLNSGQLIWNLTRQGMKGMTEVSVIGKLCLAISFRYSGYKDVFSNVRFIKTT